MHSKLTMQNKISQTQKRQHLRRPIPHPLEISPIGKTLTQKEWEKFYHRYLLPKAQRYCARRVDGTVFFLGEGGLEALIKFQEKFKDRFHFRMMCSTEDVAIQGAKLIITNDLKIEELRYKNAKNETIILDNTTAVLTLSRQS